jgi:hypothetical protein
MRDDYGCYMGVTRIATASFGLPARDHKEMEVINCTIIDSLAARAKKGI